LVGPARLRDESGTHESGELAREDADSTGGAGDKDSMAQQAAATFETVQSSEAGDGQGRGALVGNTGGDLGQVPGGDGGELGPAMGRGEEADNARAGARSGAVRGLCSTTPAMSQPMRPPAGAPWARRSSPRL
jgi:hypothetical protein